ncbi:glycosyltransferase family 4 protein [Vibrio vulnificus]|nr:glycosyltransferase family 4 protein [Vibrio vulnificus]
MKKYDAVLFFKFLRFEHLSKDIGFIYDAFLKNKKMLKISGFENESKTRDDICYITGRFNNRFSFLKTLIYVYLLRRRTKKLILLHVTRENIIISLFYRVFNKNTVYIKSDINIDSFKRRGNSFWNKNFIIDPIFKMIACRYINKISVETRHGESLVKRFFHNRIPVFYLPNSSNIKPICKSKIINKENRILYVGRLGCKHKNVEMIFEALEKLDDSPFQFDFVGPITEDFKDKVRDFIQNSSCRVDFLGPIYDKDELKKLYHRSKYFLLSSKSEGFPLVFPEALSSGCTIISSDVYAASDVVVSEKFIFHTVEELVEILKSLPDLDFEYYGYKSLEKYKNFNRDLLIDVLSDEVINARDL